MIRAGARSSQKYTSHELFHQYHFPVTVFLHLQSDVIHSATYFVAGIIISLPDYIIVIWTEGLSNQAFTFWPLILYTSSLTKRVSSRLNEMVSSGLKGLG